MIFVTIFSDNKYTKRLLTNYGYTPKSDYLDKDKIYKTGKLLYITWPFFLYFVKAGGATELTRYKKYKATDIKL